MDTVSVNAEMIRKYLKYQEKHEQEENQLSLNGMWSEDPTGWSLVRPMGCQSNAAFYEGGFLLLPVKPEITKFLFSRLQKQIKSF